MKYGLFIPTMADSSNKDDPGFAPDYNNLNWNKTVEYVKEAEELGFDSIWVPDHLIMGRNGEIFDSLTMLSALAPITHRIKLGTVVICSLFRHPGILAKMLATIDLISNGRLIAGIGSGWYQREIEAFSFPPINRERTREIVNILRQLWEKEQPVNFQGKFHNLNEAISRPQPKQSPLPLYIGGSSDKTLEITKKFANGWITSGSYEKATELIEKLKISENSQYSLNEFVWFGRIVIEKSSTDHQSVPGIIKGTIMDIKKEINQLEECGFTKVILSFTDFPKNEMIKNFAEKIL
ncbi:MAG: LLM class flavin-dependent oxidoreductase [Candidatus Hodarchaeales archaeon]|jgi:alkanesulfonate monooxygenase SsuD/methylene tetrahydromethanopterin reductase-like flavin-dependent oxidoreductase (luciferase family)